MGHLEENQPTPSLFVVRVELAYLYERLHRAEMYAPPEGGREDWAAGWRRKAAAAHALLSKQCLRACLRSAQATAGAE